MKTRKPVITIALVLIMLVSSLIPSFNVMSVYPTEDEEVEDEIVTKNIGPAEPKLIPEIVGVNQNTRAGINPNIDLILKKESKREITGNFTLKGNISLSDNSILYIKGSSLIINGWLDLSGSSKLIITDSMITVNPPMVLNNKTILNLTDNCMVTINNSELTMHKQPNETVVPYITSGDDSIVLMNNSKFSTYYPFVPMDIRWSTAGLFLITGRSSWTISNTEIFSNMNPDGAYRWCILQANSHLHLINVNNYIDDPQGTFIKPNAGTLTAVNCRLVGYIPVAIVGRADFINTNITDQLEISDLAIVSISNCKSIEKIQMGYWTGDANQSGYASPQFYFKNSKVKNIHISGNTTAVISNSTISGIIRADKDAKVTFNDSIMDNPGVPFTISDNVTLTINNPKELRQISIISGNSELTLVNVSITRLTQYQDTLHLKLKDTIINEIRSYGNMEIHGDLIDSAINEIIYTELEGEMGTLNFTLSNSKMPPAITHQNMTTQINHKLDIKTTLNSLPINQQILINLYKDDDLVLTKKTDQQGRLSVDLPYKIVTPDGNYSNEFFTLETSLMGFSTTKTISLDHSLETDISWIDTKGPMIDNIDYSPSTWNSQKWIVVSTRVTDEDVKVISNVTLRYSTDNGKTWKDKTMFNVEADNYEAMIPRQKRGTKVSFYIVAYDKVGNVEESGVKSFRVGRENSIIINGLLFLGVILCILLCLFA